MVSNQTACDHSMFPNDFYVIFTLSEGHNCLQMLTNRLPFSVAYFLLGITSQVAVSCSSKMRKFALRCDVTGIFVLYVRG